MTPSVPSLRSSDLGVGTGADDRHAGFFERTRQLQRRLAAVLDDHTLGLLDADDLQHVFQRDRLKVKTIGGVVVGGNRFRVAVDHDGLVTRSEEHTSELQSLMSTSYALLCLT